MRMLIVTVLLVLPSISHASVMRSYRLVWDTSKIAAFGMGVGHDLFSSGQTGDTHDEHDRRAHLIDERVLGPTIDAEVGITGYECSLGVKLGKNLSRVKPTYLITFLAGRSGNWIDLETNVDQGHYVFGVRLIRKYVEWAVKYHTDLEDDRMISVQFGIGE